MNRELAEKYLENYMIESELKPFLDTFHSSMIVPEILNIIEFLRRFMNLLELTNFTTILRQKLIHFQFPTLFSALSLNFMLAIGLLAFSVLLIFYGKKLWPYLMAILGAFIGYLVFEDYLYRLVPQHYQLFGLIISILILALIFGFLVRLGISWFLTFIIVTYLFSTISIIALIVGLVTFIIIWMLYKWIITVLSAIAGALLFFVSASYFIKDLPLITIITVILLVLGIIFQTLEDRKHPHIVKDLSNPS